MGKLVYLMTTSLDGYVADASGGFDWIDPASEVFAFITEQIRPVGTYLLGRRLHELMSYWETAHLEPGLSPAELEFARVWRAADKVVYSTSLTDAATARTRIERAFDPDAVRRLKEESAGDLLIEGPTLAAHALRAGLVDEITPLIAPIVVGGGLRFLPDGLRLELELVDERRLDPGTGYLRYRVLRSDT